jgi:hypothetical protein
VTQDAADDARAAPEVGSRSIRGPGVSDDDGSVAAEVAEALAAYGRDPDGSYPATLAVLQHARLLVPVVAVLGEAADATGGVRDGVRAEKSSEMATVQMRGRDGRLAQLAFTGVAAMVRWDPQARPVPLSVADAARAALQEGADALVCDVAGPVAYVIQGDDLRALADGYTLADLGGRRAWVRAPG